MYGAVGLQQQFIVRPCVTGADVSGVQSLVQSLNLGDMLLTDVQQYVNARRDDVSDVVPFSYYCLLS